MAKKWWEDIWSSPMAPEFDDSDIHGLYQLAMLVNDFWQAETPAARRAVSAEIRMAGQRFGITPMDRRRLQWEIAKSEEAVDRGRKRKAREDAGPPAEPAATPQGGFDPRRVLRSVE